MIHSDTITFKFKIDTNVWYIDGSHVSSGVIKARKCIQNESESSIKYSLSTPYRSSGFFTEDSLFSSKEDLAKAIIDGKLDTK